MKLTGDTALKGGTMDSKIVVSRNRLEENLCLFCGAELIDGVPAEMGMHIECRKKVEEIAWKQIADRKERAKRIKQLKIKAKPHHINRKP